MALSDSPEGRTVAAIVFRRWLRGMEGWIPPPQPVIFRRCMFLTLRFEPSAEGNRGKSLDIWSTCQRGWTRLRSSARLVLLLSLDTPTVDIFAFEPPVAAYLERWQLPGLEQPIDGARMHFEIVG